MIGCEDHRPAAAARDVRAPRPRSTRRPARAVGSRSEGCAGGGRAPPTIGSTTENQPVRRAAVGRRRAFDERAELRRDRARRRTRPRRCASERHLRVRPSARPARASSSRAPRCVVPGARLLAARVLRDERGERILPACERAGAPPPTPTRGSPRASACASPSVRGSAGSGQTRRAESAGDRRAGVGGPDNGVGIGARIDHQHGAARARRRPRL